MLKKFMPQRSDQTPPAENTEIGDTPPIVSVPEQKIAIQTKPVMADIKNSVSKGVKIKGSIKFANEFVFDGNLEGEILSIDGIHTVGEHADVRGISPVGGILTIGENAEVHGEVKSKTVLIKGKVHGNVTVQERCELHSRSQLIGDLKAARLVIEEGATFVGKSEVTPNKNITASNFGQTPKEEPIKPVKEEPIKPLKEEPSKPVGAPRKEF